jgi:hypothetical protein
VALLGALLSAILALHVFAIFGVLPLTEILALGLLRVAGLAPRSGWARVAEARLIVLTAATVAALGATFALLLPEGLFVALGDAARQDYALPGGTLIAGFALLSVLWLDFGFLPTAADWRPLETLRGALKPASVWLALPALAGVWVSQVVASLASAPIASGIGLALLGPPFGLALLAAAMIARPALPYLLGVDPTGIFLPHGMLIGAALGAALQVASLVVVRSFRLRRGAQAHRRPASPPVGAGSRRRMAVAPAIALGYALVLWLLWLASRGSLDGALDLVPLALAAGVLLLLSQLLCAQSLAFAGQVPLLGCAVVVLLGLARLGLSWADAVLSAVLAIAAGAIFAEAAALLRVGRTMGLGGQRVPQLTVALGSLALAALVVGALGAQYLQRGFIPPASVALAGVIEQASAPGGVGALLPWLLLGLAVQIASGPGRQGGILLATGLLLDLPVVGWAILAGLCARIVLVLVLRRRADSLVPVLGIGCIVGEIVQLALRP